MPDWAKRQVTDAIWDFFNSGYPQQVKRQICELPSAQGGHAIINIAQKIQALQMMWITKLLHAPDANWKACILYYFNKYQNLNLGLDLLNVKIRKNSLTTLPEFYRSILDTWFTLQGQRLFTPRTRGDVLCELILYNRNIVNHVTRLPLTSPELLKAEVTRLTDISYSVIPGLLPLEAFRELMSSHMTKNRIDSLYETILRSLPREWFLLLENDPHPTPSSERNTFGIFSPKDNCTIPTHKLSTKTLYEISQKLHTPSHHTPSSERNTFGIFPQRITALFPPIS